MHALNIEVPHDLARRWLDWFSPDVQPFLVDDRLASSVGVPTSDVSSLSAELRDTYCIYRPMPGLRCLWLSEAQFRALAGPERSALVRAQRAVGRELVPSVRAWASVLGDLPRRQADGHRFVWWRSLLEGVEEHVLTAYVEEGRRPSRHDEVTDSCWNTARAVLPDAQALAGTFPTRSGPNCFGTVMAAAGVAGADQVWVQREPFEAWLSERTRPGGDDGEAGTVLLWRSPDLQVQHAAVTLGEGWVLHKPSQGWMSPTKVLTIEECKASSRSVGRRLERRSVLR